MIEVESLLSGITSGFHVTLPPSFGGRIVSGIWSEDNRVLPFVAGNDNFDVGGNCLHDAEYQLLVESAKEAMRRNGWKKIVTSRCFEIQRPNNGWLDYYHHLVSRFPDCFLIVLNHPQWGIWIAASPELLVYKRGNELQTMALAGTLSAHSPNNWTDKEIREHEVVRDMIVDTLVSNGSLNIALGDREELLFRSIRHLRTNIKAEHSGDIKRVIETLSPTPALAGMPVRETVEWLIQNEQYNRGLYGGIIQVSNQDEIWSIVILRCLNIKSNGALGFVGGGVMPDSNAEIEWNETVMKQKAFIFVANEDIE